MYVVSWTSSFYYYYQSPLKAFAEIGLQLRLHRLLFERSRPYLGWIPGPCVAETDDQAGRQRIQHQGILC